MRAMNMRRALIWGAATIATGTPGALFAQQRAFELPAQSATRSIPEFARQAGIQIVAPGSKLRQFRTRRLSGTQDVRAALRTLIEGTGLRILSDDGRTITLGLGTTRTSEARARTPVMAALPAPTGAQSPTTGDPSPDEGTPADPSASGDIVVTASKRSERVLDVPASLTAFRGQDLLAKGYTSLADYLTLTPGVQFSSAIGTGAPVIRGLNAGNDVGSLVGLVVDGAPIGGSATVADSGVVSLDLDPIDLERVEVLKGPQGTLYGANSLGGLVSYVTAKPDLNTFKAIVRGGLNGTQDGGTSYSLRGAASAPLIQDTLAVRVSGYIDRPSGFIDNAVSATADQNGQRNWGVNGSVLVRPTSRLTINLNGFYQRVNQLAQDHVIYGPDGRPRDGDLAYNDYLVPTFSKRLRVGVATVDYDLDFAKLDSVTSYQKSDADIGVNATQGSLAATLPILALFGGQSVPAPGLVFLNDQLSDKKFTQELRLTSVGSSRLQYVAGLYYSNEDYANIQTVIGSRTDRSPVATLDPALAFNLSGKYREIAGFANVTYKITDRLDVTGGLRIGRISQDYRQLFYGSDAAAFNALLGTVGAPATPADTGLNSQSQTIKNYLATARYHFSRDGMVYARFATGFRPGGPNADVLGLPASYNADSTNNYEAGIKTKFLGGLGTVEAAGYYTTWKDILISVGSGGISGFANGGSARIYGAEGTVTLRPLTGVSLVATASYNNAKISSINPLAATSEGIGDPLPNNPKWSGSVSADYRQPVSDGYAMVAGVTARYVGQRHAYLRSSQLYPDWIMPEYALVDLHIGLNSSKVDIDLYMRNLTNKRAELSALTFYGLNEITIQRPRTIGAAVTFKY